MQWSAWSILAFSFLWVLGSITFRYNFVLRCRHCGGSENGQVCNTSFLPKLTKKKQISRGDGLIGCTCIHHHKSNRPLDSSCLCRWRLQNNHVPLDKSQPARLLNIKNKSFCFKLENNLHVDGLSPAIATSIWRAISIIRSRPHASVDPGIPLNGSFDASRGNTWSTWNIQCERTSL